MTARNNIVETWRILLAQAEVPDRSEPLSNNILKRNPDHPVVKTLTWVYTSDGFVFKTLNASSRSCDESKIDTMGPYAIALA